MWLPGAETSIYFQIDPNWQSQMLYSETVTGRVDAVRDAVALAGEGATLVPAHENVTAGAGALTVGNGAAATTVTSLLYGGTAALSEHLTKPKIEILDIHLMANVVRAPYCRRLGGAVSSAYLRGDVLPGTQYARGANQFRGDV